METTDVLKFDNALYGVSQRLRRILTFIEDKEKEKIEEIRLRTEKPLSVTINGEALFVSEKAILEKDIKNAVLVTKEDVEEAFKNLIANSVYSHINEIKQGFVMMKGGCRAGIAGTFSEQAGITDISSVNIRIAREIYGVSNKLFSRYSGGGVLICGKAGSGKTTLLRDFIRRLSDSGLRVSAVDSRGELSASYKGVCYNDLGINTDVLLGFSKEYGMECALRTLCPQIIAFDEIGSVDEVIKVSDCIHGGAHIVTTAHLEDIRMLKKRKITQKLLETGAVSFVIMMEKEKGNYTVYSFDEVKKLCGF